MLTAAATAPRPGTSGSSADDLWFRGWRARELARLDDAGMTYVDYTGSALAPASLLRADSERMLHEVVGNPHSDNPASNKSTIDLADARMSILRFLNADPDEYQVVITANASAALRLVGEGFRFGSKAEFLLTADNHNSVVGIREFAKRSCATTRVIPLDGELRSVEPEFGEGGLFAFPAQSNFSGVRHDLGWIETAHQAGYRVLLDAAAFLPTAELDLSVHNPDFVALSLYKIIGWPTGVGALVAKRSALEELHRPWFAGGTVDWVSVTHGSHQSLVGPERFEDGTPPFMLAGAVRPALGHLESIGRDRLSRHLQRLTGLLLDSLNSLRHSSGAEMVVRYGPSTTAARGATVAFNLLDPEGATIPFWTVERAAAAAGLSIRGGCFCNPGCAEAAFDWPTSRVGDLLRVMGRDFTIAEFGAALGGPAVGAIRVSLGLGSTHQDVERTVDVLESIGRS